MALPVYIQTDRGIEQVSPYATVPVGSIVALPDTTDRDVGTTPQPTVAAIVDDYMAPKPITAPATGGVYDGEGSATTQTQTGSLSGGSGTTYSGGGGVSTSTPTPSTPGMTIPKTTGGTTTPATSPTNVNYPVVTDPPPGAEWDASVGKWFTVETHKVWTPSPDPDTPGFWRDAYSTQYYNVTGPLANGPAGPAKTTVGESGAGAIFSNIPSTVWLVIGAVVLGYIILKG